jgi:hypothetical protein
MVRIIALPDRASDWSPNIPAAAPPMLGPLLKGSLEDTISFHHSPLIQINLAEV